MTRVHLAQLLRDLTSAHDYAFFSAPDEYMPSEIDRYPAAWLAPPRLKEVEGRRHGKRTYEIQLHLLQPGFPVFPPCIEGKKRKPRGIPFPGLKTGSKTE